MNERVLKSKGVMNYLDQGLNFGVEDVVAKFLELKFRNSSRLYVLRIGVCVTTGT